MNRELLLQELLNAHKYQLRDMGNIDLSGVLNMIIAAYHLGATKGAYELDSMLKYSESREAMDESTKEAQENGEHGEPQSPTNPINKNTRKTRRTSEAEVRNQEQL